MKFFKRTKAAVLCAFCACVVIAAAAFAAIPANPYGSKNVTSAQYPEHINKYFVDKAAKLNLNFTSPWFANGRAGSVAVQGEMSTTTTQEELMTFVKGLAKNNMRWEVVGKFQSIDPATGAKEGELFEMPLLVFSKPPVFNAGELRALDKPIVWLQGQIHGNESTGGEAMMVLAKRLAEGDLVPLLDKISVVILPRYNVDGAWKYQRGTDTYAPVRVNMDMNRDNMTFESPIVAKVHDLLNAYKPHVAGDAHEMGYTAGSDRASVWSADAGKNINVALPGNSQFYRFDVATLYAPHPNLPKSLRDMGYGFETNYIKHAKDKGVEWSWYFVNDPSTGYHPTYSKSDWVYVSADVISTDGATLVSGERQALVTVSEGDPDEGITDPATGLKGCFAMLTESRSPKPGMNYANRVNAHVVVYESLLNSVAGDAVKVKATVEAARAEMVSLGETVSDLDTIKLILKFGAPENNTIPALKTVKAGSGLVAEETSWEVKGLRVRDMTAKIEVVRPYAYIISADSAVISRLYHTGATFERLAHDTDIEVEAYSVTKIEKTSPVVYMDNTNNSGYEILGVSPQKKTVKFPAGTYVMYMNQVSATHAALALEPLAKRNYGNYWLSRSGAGKDGFLPVAVGADFPAYRYMTEKKLVVNLNLAAGPNAVLSPLDINHTGYLITQIRSYTQKKIYGPMMLSGITGDKFDSVDLETIHRSLSSGSSPFDKNVHFYLYDTSAKKMVEIIPNSSGQLIIPANARQYPTGGAAAAVTGPYSLEIATAYDLKHTPSGGSSSSGGCNAGFAFAALLVLGPVLFVKKK